MVAWYPGVHIRAYTTTIGSFEFPARFATRPHALALCFVACSSACDDAASEAKDAPVPEAASAPATPPEEPRIGGEDFDPIAELAGTWIVPNWRGDDSSKAPWGMRMLWEVDGSVLTQSNGVTTLRYDLKRRGPCLVRAKRQDKNKVSGRALLFDGEQLFTETGGFDSPDGRFVHVCDQTFSRYLRVERGQDTCTYVEQPFGTASKTCKVVRHDDQELVIDTGASTPLRLTRKGAVWLEAKPGGSKSAKRYADKDAAMAVLGAAR